MYGRGKGDARLDGKKQQLPFHISTMPSNHRETVETRDGDREAWQETRRGICPKFLMLRVHTYSVNGARD